MITTNNYFNSEEKLRNILIPLYIEASEKADPSRRLSSVTASITRNAVYFAPVEGQPEGSWLTTHSIGFDPFTASNRQGENARFIELLTESGKTQWNLNKTMFKKSQAIEFTVKFSFEFRDTGEKVEPFEEISFSIKA